jgi:hypothetical protein
MAYREQEDQVFARPSPDVIRWVGVKTLALGIT